MAVTIVKSPAIFHKTAQMGTIAIVAGVAYECIEREQHSAKERHPSINPIKWWHLELLNSVNIPQVVWL